MTKRELLKSYYIDDAVSLTLPGKGCRFFNNSKNSGGVGYSEPHPAVMAQGDLSVMSAILLLVE